MNHDAHRTERSADAGPPTVRVLTPAGAGGVAMVQLLGSGLAPLLGKLCRPAPPAPDGVARLRRLADVDHGLVLWLRHDWAQLHPHGGPRLVDRIVRDCLDAGAVIGDADLNPDAAVRLYPEAASTLEATALGVIAEAASPVAVDHLLRQPELWRKRLGDLHDNPSLRDASLARAHAWRSLVTPPAVAVIGEANAGKSTLVNAMLGGERSLVSCEPGTTRDWVSGVGVRDGVAIQWIDTPGARVDADPIERRAVDAARAVIAAAAVHLVVAPPHAAWPPHASPGAPAPHVRFVRTKIDLDNAPPEEPTGDGRDPARPIRVSAATGQGEPSLLHELHEALAIADALGPHDDTPWPFHPMLAEALRRNDHAELARWTAD